MKLSTIFRLTREYMENDPDASPFICDNIKRIKAPRARIADAREVIQWRIDGCFSIQDWLLANGHITPKEFFGHDGYESCTLSWNRHGKKYEKLRAYRLAWLSELEREFAAAGN